MLGEVFPKVVTYEQRPKWSEETVGGKSLTDNQTR